ncbi:MAG: ABC transporter ATP-binding protein [Gammaproteobacteria bacterium]|nr:ABC transporter ATP-binding protein [Gammaproteobacteria bacterium]
MPCIIALKKREPQAVIQKDTTQLICIKLLNQLIKMRSDFKAYTRSLATYAGFRLYLVLLIMILSGLAEGASLLMLIPLLRILGINTQNDLGGSSESQLEKFFSIAPITLTTILSVFVFVLIAKALLNRWREIMLTELWLGFVDYLRIKVFSAISRADWLFLLRKRKSAIIHTLAADLTHVGDGTYYFLELVVSFFLALVYILVALYLSVASTSLALSTGILLIVIVRPQSNRARDLGIIVSSSNANVFNIISDFLDGLKLAKSHGAERQYACSFSSSISRLREYRLQFVRSYTIANVIHQVGSAVSLALLLYISFDVLYVPMAELLALIYIFSRLAPLLSRLQQNYQHTLHMLPAFESAIELQSESESAKDAGYECNSSSPILSKCITLSNLYFRYNKSVDKNALENVSATIPARKITVLIGHSGSGKSTFADILLGLLTPTAGIIKIDDEILDPTNLGNWRRSVAYLPQDSFLFPGTLRSNLLWARPEASEHILWDVLKMASADQFVAKMPNKLDTVIHDRGENLSGGERQRIVLARALLLKPQLLILDEPTSALDSDNELRVIDTIKRLSSEYTIVIVSHNSTIIEQADQIIVLDSGKVVTS